MPFVTYICYLSQRCAMAYLLLVTDMCYMSYTGLSWRCSQSLHATCFRSDNDILGYRVTLAAPRGCKVMKHQQGEEIGSIWRKDTDIQLRGELE